MTVTKEDLKNWGVDGKPQKGVIGLDELCKKGVYQVQRKFGDEYQHIAYKDFIDDPKGNPLDSASGKFEFYCQAKADQFNTCAMAGETYKPYPTVPEHPVRRHRPRHGRFRLQQRSGEGGEMDGRHARLRRRHADHHRSSRRNGRGIRRSNHDA